jgi:predicted dehydrogenase
MRTMIAGLGSIGRRHLRNLVALGSREVIAFRTHKSTLRENDLPAIVVETDLSHALAHEPQAVIIANPTSLHMEVALPAAKAGCHILLEKPIASDLTRIGELKEALKNGGGKLLVGYQFRFHPGLQKAHKLIQEGALGKIMTVKVEWGESLPEMHPWEDYRKAYTARADLGGGVVLTFSHPFDYLRWMIGEVDELSATVSRLGGLDLDVEDVADINLHFSNGVVGNIHLDYYRHPAEHRLEITGSEGTLEWRNLTGVTRLYRKKVDSWESFLPKQGFERNDLFLEEMKHFMKVVAGQEEPVCSLNDGIQALKIALSVLASSKAKRSIRIE